MYMYFIRCVCVNIASTLTADMKPVQFWLCTVYSGGQIVYPVYIYTCTYMYIYSTLSNDDSDIRIIINCAIWPKERTRCMQ